MNLCLLNSCGLRANAWQLMMKMMKKKTTSLQDSLMVELSEWLAVHMNTWIWIPMAYLHKRKKEASDLSNDLSLLLVYDAMTSTFKTAVKQNRFARKPWKRCRFFLQSIWDSYYSDKSVYHMYTVIKSVFWVPVFKNRIISFVSFD